MAHAPGTRVRRAPLPRRRGCRPGPSPCRQQSRRPLRTTRTRVRLARPVRTSESNVWVISRLRAERRRYPSTPRGHASRTRNGAPARHPRPPAAPCGGHRREPPHLNGDERPVPGSPRPTPAGRMPPRARTPAGRAPPCRASRSRPIQRHVAAPQRAIAWPTMEEQTTECYQDGAFFSTCHRLSSISIRFASSR